MATGRWKKLALELGFTQNEIDLITCGPSDPERDCWFMSGSNTDRQYILSQHLYIFSCTNFLFPLGSRPSHSSLLSLSIPGPKKIEIAEMATGRWKKLALELGFTQNEIDLIASGPSDPERDCWFMLTKWLEHRDLTVTWDRLITALMNVGLTGLAEDLRKGTTSAFILFTALLVWKITV